MPIKTGWLTPERKAVLTRIRTDYGRHWARAFEENPNWVQLLDYGSPLGKKNCWNTVSRMVLQARKQPELSLATQARLADSDRGEKMELITKIVKNYTVDGKTQWKAAFAEHPEWAKALKNTDRREMMWAYARGAAIAKQLRRAKAQSNGAHQRTAAVAEPVAATPALPDPIRFCPS